jgi:uncharacterized protein YjbI with pentapeptide repeats
MPSPHDSSVGQITAESNTRQTGCLPGDLRGKDLRTHELRGKNLKSADLRGADLRGVDLTGASLSGAQMQQAKLDDIVLRDVNLSFANFCDNTGTAEAIKASEATGLLAINLAGSNLKGARLPEKLVEFPTLKNAEEASKNATAVIFTMVAFCLFCLLTVGTMSDVALLTNGAITATIPGIGLSIPVVPFLLFAPFLLLILQLYFILNLQRYEELLSELPSVFPDGLPLYQKVYPWLFSSLAYSARTERTWRGSALMILEAFASISITYIMVPASIWIIWLKILRQHSFLIWTTMAALAISILVSLAHFVVGKATLRLGRRAPWSLGKIIPKWFAIAVPVAAYLFYIGAGLSLQAIQGRIEADPGYVRLDAPPVAPQSDWQKILSLVGASQCAHVTTKDVSIKPVSWTGRITEGEPELSAVKGADLSYANLRYLRAFRAFLVNSQLDDSDLTGAVLNAADLRGADLTAALLNDADMAGANLSSMSTPSNLRYAELIGADLSDASVEKANLYHADLTRAKLKNSKLHKAVLSYATLSDAQLDGADLSGALLNEAKGLTLEQLATASLDEDTRVTSPFILGSCLGEGYIRVELKELAIDKSRSWTIRKPGPNDGVNALKEWKDRIKRLRLPRRCAD